MRDQQKAVESFENAVEALYEISLADMREYLQPYLQEIADLRKEIVCLKKQLDAIKEVLKG